MTVNYTTLLGLAQPVTGTEAGAWGDVVNNYITSFLDASVAGTQTISGSQTAVTLSITNGSALVTAGSGATGSAQFQIINCTGNPASLLTITAPASSRQYIIINATSTSQSVKIVGSGPTTGVTLVSGEKAHVAWNGSDFVKIATQNGSGTFTTVNTTNLEVTNIKAKDGTASMTLADTTGAITLSATAGTANGVTYLNGSRVLTSGSALTFDGTNFINTVGYLGTTQSGATSSYFIAKNSIATSGVVFGAHSSGAGYIDVINNNPLFFAVNDTEQMRLTTTGLKSSIAGSNSDPVFSYTSDTNTGIFFPAADKLGFVAGGGTNDMVLTTTGLGIGTATPQAKLQVLDQIKVSNSAQSQGALVLGDGGSTAFNVGVARWNGSTNAAGAGGLGYFAQGASNAGGHWFYTGDAAAGSTSLRMVIDTSGTLILRQSSNAANTSVSFNTTVQNALTLDSSGNLGVGTASPSASARLTVARNDGIIQIERATGTTYPFSFGIASDGRFNIYDVTAAAERLAITQAGNLGLGVTPSAWSSPFVAMQIGTGGATLTGRTDGQQVNLATNWRYTSGSNLYIANGYASRYAQESGTHAWSNAPNNTSGAGAPLTFTQALTLTEVSNLKLGGTADRGTTVGTNHLDIFNGTAPVGTLTNGISLYSAAGEAYVMDAAGNATLFSPHDRETNEWIFRSKHTPTGKVLKIDVEKLLRFINDHFGLDAVHEFIEE